MSIYVLIYPNNQNLLRYSPSQIHVQMSIKSIFLYRLSLIAVYVALNLLLITVCRSLKHFTGPYFLRVNCRDLKNYKVPKMVNTVVIKKL